MSTEQPTSPPSVESAPPEGTGSTHTDHAQHADHEELGFWRKFIFATDHKIIGLAPLW